MILKLFVKGSFESFAARISKQHDLRHLKHPLRPVLTLRSVQIWIIILTFGLTLIAQGCASVPKRNAIPENLSGAAKVPGIPNARVWGDEPPPYEEQWLRQSKAEIKAQHPAIFGKRHSYLAISGGGANGAFGAGLLVGWTKAGNRPEFTLVTGISTGALIAPFAFLGPDYDDLLKKFYTTLTTKDILKKRNLLTALTSDAGASTEPLKEIITKNFDRKILEAIAAEHKRGRRLWIGTTNLDAGRPVIWNIGFIAMSKNPDALDLVHRILLASASIPAAFPPVYIEVEANGRRYDEMHVDGGAASQVFLYPSEMDWKQVLEKLEAEGRPRVYVIRNSRIKPDFETVKPKLFPIAGRSIKSLIRTQGIGDLYQIYSAARRDGLDFNLAYIPDDFEMKPKEAFDPAYMTRLFELGYNMAKTGYPWKKEPPGYK